MEHQEARDRMEAYLHDCNDKEREQAKVLRGILVKCEIESSESNMSSSGMTKEELEVLGDFLVNRTSVGSFRTMTKQYLDWVSRL